MREVEAVMGALARSRFRAKFRLGSSERAYLHLKGRLAVMSHAREFVSRRLAPAHPPADGKQTPMRGHPVFIAQHATATCCRGCLEKWHGIPRGRALPAAEQEYVTGMIDRWLRSQDPGIPETGEPTLFEMD